MVPIPAGEYIPLLRGRDEPERVPVAAFRLDARPVTNAEFLAFVKSKLRRHPFSRQRPRLSFFQWCQQQALAEGPQAAAARAVLGGPCRIDHHMACRPSAP